MLACTICGVIENKPVNILDKCKFHCGGHYMPYDGETIYVGKLRHAKSKVYDLIQQIGGSEKYGNCERCGKAAEPIFSYKNIFGHKECIIKI